MPYRFINCGTLPHHSQHLEELLKDIGDFFNKYFDCYTSEEQNLQKTSNES